MYLPLGLKSASTGTCLPMRVKSSSSSGTFAACAIASRCSTALVEPLERDHHRDRILERLARQDLRRRDARLHQLDDGLARVLAIPDLAAATPLPAQNCSASSCPAPRSREAIVFAVYMPAQLPGPGIAVRSISRISRRRDCAARECAARFEHGNHVAMFRTRTNRAAVNEYRRPIETRKRDQATRHVLVASADRHDAVEALRARSPFRSNPR